MSISRIVGCPEWTGGATFARMAYLTLFLKKHFAQLIIKMLTGMNHNVIEIAVEFFKHFTHADEVGPDTGNCCNSLQLIPFLLFSACLR